MLAALWLHQSRAKYANNVLVGECMSDFHCRSHQVSKVYWDPNDVSDQGTLGRTASSHSIAPLLAVQGTNGYMGKCPCFKSKWDHTLYLATNSCDSPQKEVLPGACVPMQDYKPWNLLCALPKNPKADRL